MSCELDHSTRGFLMLKTLQLSPGRLPPSMPALLAMEVDFLLECVAHELWRVEY
ncbi:hypothetical protein [Mumia zhuanghuii]|uniref:hypothetical protein n=1 Tax=Mumia zhuanghuii TaxID=2585211 RepID=UPI00129CCE69|nr:hypothetical protein [Mumia zhuanghuii]